MQPVDVTQATREHFARLHRAALVLTGSPWDADDLAQETFLVLAKQPGQYQGRSGLYTWLYGILLNLERRRRRRDGLRKFKLRVLWNNESSEKTVPAAETPLEVAEWKKSLWCEVAKLPDGQRQALVLRFSEHLRYDEIAEILECPLGTVKSRIFHGLAALRERLVSHDGNLTADIPADAWEDMTRAV